MILFRVMDFFIILDEDISGINMDNKKEKDLLKQLSSIEQFKAMFVVVKQNLQRCSNHEELCRFIKTDIVNFSQLIIVLGDLEVKSNENNPEKYWFNYLIPEAFKTVFVFATELFLELSKAQLFFKENHINESVFSSVFSESQTLLYSNLTELEELVQPDLYTNTKEIDVDYALQHYDNPWDIYRTQLILNQDQLHVLTESFEQAFEYSQVFISLKEIINIHGQKVMNSCNELKLITNSIADDLERKEDVSALIQTLNNKITDDTLIDKTHQQFTDDLNEEINKFESIQIPKSLIDGQLILTDFQLEHSIRKWLDYEVLSNFIDLWALKDNLKNFFRVNLTHIKNNLRIKLDSNEPIDYDSLYESLNKLFEQIKKHQNKEEQIVEDINTSISNHLKMVHYFNDANPLEIPLKNSINLRGSDVLKKIKDWVSLISKPLFDKTHIHHDTELETATQCIAYRLMKVENEQYDSLFLNKNFIGDLFLIKRPVLESKISKTIDLWNNGFNQSALIIGNRLSGKTTFINYVSRLHFDKKVLYLEPNSELIISGRKLKVGYNLNTVLSELKKYTHQNNNTAIVIDDLEHWHSKEHSLLENTRSLIRFLESESDHTFVLVSCSSLLKNILNKRLGFSKSFSTIVDVSKANENEIIQAVQLRHGASHKNLYNLKMEQLSPSQIKKMIHKQIKRNDFNLGEILQAWTYTTVVKDYNKVVISGQYSDFPNFFTSDELLVLKQIFLYRSSNEYRLKTTMGFAKDEELRSAIKRLLNTKVIERDINGNLSINSIVLQDIQNILQKKLILSN